MKTKTFFVTSLIALALAALVFSCDNPVSLGPKLDLDGPVVEIVSPDARTAGKTFLLTGTIKDESAIDKIEITAMLGRNLFEKQWRYTRSAGWRFTEDNGASWHDIPNAKWEGSEKSANWAVPLDMLRSGAFTPDGEYMFKVQAWDVGTMSDDNSLRTRVLIYDSDPPKVKVYNPMLYSRYANYDPVQDKYSANPEAEPDDYDGNALQNLRDSADWKKPELLGKFLTQEFLLQWQIENDYDLRLVDLRFYRHDEPIDGNPDTELPDTYYYRYLESSGNIKPNGSVWVPPLENAVIPADDARYAGGEIKTPVPAAGKTTIKIVALCKDAAGNANTEITETQEKVLGYFIYWPEASAPWVTFTDGMDPTDYTAMDGENFEENVATVYPGRSINATAFQAQGVSRVEFTIHTYLIDETPPYEKTTGDALDLRGTPQPGEVEYAGNTVIIKNEKRKNDTYSTIFPWKFTPPPRSANYMIRAQAFDFNGNPGAICEGVFRVQDVTFPDFPTLPEPKAGDPLFKSIGNDGAPANSIRIHGKVADATAIESVYMAWINPQSLGYATMNQLAYFRDPNYEGWRKAIEAYNDDDISDGEYIEEHINSTHDNKVWKVAVNVSPVMDPDTGRMVYTYSQIIELTDDLNIGTGINDQPLKSQVFLLRAENQDEKATIITYAPQGDESPPKISITKVTIGGVDYDTSTSKPIAKFNGTETITVHGTWEEDSAGFLPIATYFTPNFTVEINEVTLTSINPIPASGAANGTWTATIAVSSNPTLAANLKDTLVVSAKVSDIGGNKTEAGASWLIESDELKLMRISSENDDTIYNQGKLIDIFLEFNKAVQLVSSAATPTLTLNTGGTAVYNTSKNTGLSTRHYFTYTVGASQNTPVGVYLNVTGINNYGTPAWNANDYPFTWHRGSGDTEEKIRVTMENGHNGSKPGANDFYARHLPVNISDTIDGPLTLGKGKNIVIDTTAPTVSGIVSATPAGDYTTNAVINIDVTFDEAVEIGTTTPQLRLTLGTATVTTDGVVTFKNGGKTMSFSYTVKAGDTSNGNNVVVSTYTGNIIDSAGNALAPNGITTFTGSNKTLTGVYVDAVSPGVPTVRILTANNVGNVLTNTVNGQTRTGNSTAANRDLANVYNTNLWYAIEGTLPSPSPAGDYDLSYLEYSISGGTDTNSWVRFGNNTNTPIALTLPGEYNIVARQYDRAGNVSSVSPPINFTWDNGGNFISRIETTSAAGTYTNSTGRTDTIPITVYFRKPVTFQAAPTLTLNARNTPSGTGGTAATASATSATMPNGTTAPSITGTSISSITFTYAVGASDNTASNTPLAVTSFNITSGYVRDAQSVQVNTLVTPLPAVTNFGKNIYIQTVALTLSTGPTWTRTNNTGEEWEGTISITFNHDIIKGTTGEITIAQSTTGYRLPAVLTEAQSNRYKNIANFGTFYTKGTNGFSGSSPDTSTKYVLNYGQTAVVTPNPNANAGTIARLASDFRNAESVTIPVTSQDVSVSGSTLTITLIGSNALQVLGASYTLTIPANIVQDDLGYTWSPSNTYPYTTAGINRPFTRVDKKIDRDGIDTANGSNTQPWLSANFTNVIQTTARLDCRTPGSVVRYIDNGTRYDARGAANTATGVTTVGTTGTAQANWMNTDTNANNTSYGTGGTPSATSTLYGGANGTDFASNITVGDNTQHGYVWRVSARSFRSNSTTESTYSDVFDEVAFRTVLTVQIAGISGGTQPGSGDQLWIRGGDAPSSSSVPGFPLRWGEDDWNSLNTENKRAGIRLLDLISATTDFSTTSEWKWITWEVNVETYFEIFLGRGINAAGTGPGTTPAPNTNQAWQYGPRFFAPQRGGWAQWKDLFHLYPGKHRWVCMQAGSWVPAGSTNFATTWQSRPSLTATLTPP